MRSCKCVLPSSASGSTIVRSMSLPDEEVSEVHEFTVPLILDIDHTPSVLPASNRLAVDNDTALGANNREREHFLSVSFSSQESGDFQLTRIRSLSCSSSSSLSSASNGYDLIWLCCISAMTWRVSWSHSGTYSAGAAYSLLEHMSLLECQRIRLGDDWNDIDDFC